MTDTAVERIALVTDFGAGIYVGQVVARLSALLPGVPVIDLVHDLPPFRPDLAAYLLPAMVRDMPSGTLYLCVVDPGVGGGRAGLAAEADGNLFVGPDNGLLALVVRRARESRLSVIDWMPTATSASFHGRDWFAPAAARLCLGQAIGDSALSPGSIVGTDWPDDLPRLVYEDRYGNLMTGLRADRFPAGGTLEAAGVELPLGRTFCEVPQGRAFWYENSLGLVEIAANGASAARLLGLSPGDPVSPPLPRGAPGGCR